MSRREWSPLKISPPSKSVPPQNLSPRTVRSRINGPPGPNIAATPGPSLPRMVPPLLWRSKRMPRLISGPGRMKLTMRYVSLSRRLGFRGELNNGTLYSCMFGSKLWPPVTVPFSYSRSIPRQVVESRVESALWQENGRVHW